MALDDGKKMPKNEEQEPASKTITSMLFSVFLVCLALAFVVGFRAFLRSHNYQNRENGKASLEENASDEKEILSLDEEFQPTYLIVKNLSQKEFCKTKEPGKAGKDSKRLTDGQLLYAQQKGTRDGKTYYRLKDGSYLEEKESYIQELKEYVPLDGYIVITYISSSGVRVRSWVDYEADNVVKSVYVGDKVPVTAMVTTKGGESAFRTSEGYYITTDSRYFTDYTDLKEKSSEESTKIK